MIPYRGRLSLELARVALGLAGLGWYGIAMRWHPAWVVAVLAGYGAFALASLSLNFKLAALAVDTAYFALWIWLAPGTWPPSVAACYLLTSAAILHDFQITVPVAAMTVLLALPKPWVELAAGTVAVSMSFYKRFLDRRISAVLGNNVLIRSRAEAAKNTERERIAADFHDGPLQNFVSFNLRLEVIRKLLARDVDAAAEELGQLQKLCQSQVGDLRSFARGMRPPDEGLTMGESLSRLVDSFQRDTGIPTTFEASEFRNPSARETVVELLQIVREALTNIHKHSGATRVAVSAACAGERLEIVVEDNGSGFPFDGIYSLEDLELHRLGPISIKRRVRLLGGDMVLESKSGSGARIQILIPLRAAP